jgi:3-deoxy-manno-octulosonate cytidylyltransferase (CMP-KDO synthetase)
MLQHVYERASQARYLTSTIIATDDERIYEVARNFGARVRMTRSDHPSGTDRVAEVAGSLDVDIVINVQGDEPLIDPASLELLADLLRKDPLAEMATLAMPIADEETYRNPNCVKVVCGEGGRALYFSRSPIPYVRDGHPEFGRSTHFLHHLGLYAYRRSALLTLADLPPHPLEQLEKLEQLRALAQGWTIRVGVVAHAGRGVDTPADYQRFVAEYRALTTG